jgi:hypothetical protein
MLISGCCRRPHKNNFVAAINSFNKHMSQSSQKVESPNAGWNVGDKQPSPFGTEFITLDPAQGGNFYNLMISGVVPRPVAFVSTQSTSGINNLAPFSYFSAAAHDPPTVSVGICQSR